MQRTPPLVVLLVVLLIAAPTAAASVSVSFSLSTETKTLSTADGDITLSGTADGTLHEVEGDWTNSSTSLVGAPGITLDPDDKQAVRAGSSYDYLNFSDITINDNETDIVIKHALRTRLTIYGQPGNVTLYAVNETGSVLDTNQTTDSGAASFTIDLSQEIRIQADTPADLAPIGNNTTLPDTGNWTNGSTNATLSTMVDYISRIPGVAIGGGDTGLGAAGALVLGLIGTAGVVIAPSTVSAGPVAGAVAGISAIGAVTAVGLAPEWLFAIVLFALGAVATAVVIRAWS